MKDVYKNIEEQNPERKCEMLIIFADMISIKEHNQIVTELFIKGRRLNISTVFITQFYFTTSNDVRLNYTHLFYYENPKQMTASTNCVSSSDIGFKEFLIFF